ncbi:hypothetical protein INR49_018614 [Caranx melampygus]|nr:hypothetical protein INR49_018614 [Caranx melampygus]
MDYPHHMYIEEYIEEDEEPPLLLSSCPSHGVWLWWDCSSAVSVGGRVCVSAVPCRRGAFQGLWADPKSNRGSAMPNVPNWNVSIHCHRGSFHAESLCENCFTCQNSSHSG